MGPMGGAWGRSTPRPRAQGRSFSVNVAARSPGRRHTPPPSAGALALGIAPERHPAKAAAKDVRDAVVLRQSLVDEGVVRAHELGDAAVLAQDALHEQLGLAAEGLAEVVVEVGEQARVRGDRVEL